MDDKKSFAQKLEGILTCPFLVYDCFDDPVVTTAGQTYSRKWIELHCKTKGTDPKTREIISRADFIPNLFAQNLIDKLKNNGNFDDSDIICPISGVVITDPVIAPSGLTCERSALQQQLNGQTLITNYVAKDFIELYQKEKHHLQNVQPQPNNFNQPDANFIQHQQQQEREKLERGRLESEKLEQNRARDEARRKENERLTEGFHFDLKERDHSRLLHFKRNYPYLFSSLRSSVIPDNIFGDSPLHEAIRTLDIQLLDILLDDHEAMSQFSQRNLDLITPIELLNSIHQHQLGKSLPSEHGYVFTPAGRNQPLWIPHSKSHILGFVQSIKDDIQLKLMHAHAAQEAQRQRDAQARFQQQQQQNQRPAPPLTPIFRQPPPAPAPQEIKDQNYICMEIIAITREKNAVLADSKRIALINFIRSHPEYINQKNTGNQTPLHFARVHNQTKILSVLLEMGADLNSTTIPPNRKNQADMYLENIKLAAQKIEKQFPWLRREATRSSGQPAVFFYKVLNQYANPSFLDVGFTWRNHQSEVYKLANEIKRNPNLTYSDCMKKFTEMLLKIQSKEKINYQGTLYGLYLAMARLNPAVKLNAPERQNIHQHNQNNQNNQNRRNHQ